MKLSAPKSLPTLLGGISETPTATEYSGLARPIRKIRQLLGKGFTFFNFLSITCHKLLSYTLKVFVVSMILYSLQDVLAIYALRADEATCKGWDCPDLWCPDTYSIKVPGGAYVECEKLEQYLEETGL